MGLTTQVDRVMLKGARQGNLECMARIAALNLMRVEDASPLPPFPEHEIAEWVENYLGDSDAVEFYCADFLMEEGNEEEVAPVLAKEASAGCPKCQGALAARYFAENPHSPVLDAQDRLKDAEAAAEHGCVHSAILAATLYRDGKVAPQNKDKAELYAVLALTFGDDALQQMGEDLMEELVGEGSGYWETQTLLVCGCSERPLRFNPLRCSVRRPRFGS